MFTEALKTIFFAEILPNIVKAVFGKLLLVPLLGPGIEWVVAKVVTKLVEEGIIELKVSLIDKLSSEAKERYAPMIQLMRDWQAQDELTDEQEEEYEKRLKEITRSRPGVVNG